jgi:hypothetical protein
MAARDDLFPRGLKGRKELFDYLDGHSVKVADELFDRRSSRSLLKSYVLETARGQGDGFAETLRRRGYVLAEAGGDGLWRVRRPGETTDSALLEYLTPRHPVVYTTLPAQESDRWIERLVSSSSTIDRLWLSPFFLQSVWLAVCRSVEPHRFTRLTFEFEALYEEVESTDVRDDWERKTSRFALVDRIEELRRQLPAVAEILPSVNALAQIRIPGAYRGGHDLFHDGKMTNRSDSFFDHRDKLVFISRQYQDLTEQFEETLWVRYVGDTDGAGAFRGVPLLIKFGTTLPEIDLSNWIEATFNRRRRNPFRLAGRARPLGRGKYHITAVDEHLWQPIELEATTSHILAILPSGTCGNTVHRLITNTQRYLSPRVEVWLGDEPLRIPLPAIARAEPD